jgi:hypothetical protein
MKKSCSLTLVLCLWFCQCQKEVKPLNQQELTQAAMLGKWKLLSVTDRFHQTFTNADPCFADDTFEFTNDYAIISQGSCIEFPDKAPVIQFLWKFVAEDMVDMGGDTVKIIQSNDTSLVFKREDPQYLEYHWFRK